MDLPPRKGVCPLLRIQQITHNSPEQKQAFAKKHIVRINLSGHWCSMASRPQAQIQNQFYHAEYSQELAEGHRLSEMYILNSVQSR